MNLHTTSLRRFLVLPFLCVLFFNSFGQNYGLGISVPPLVQENNTGLDLSPTGQICLDGNFEISFDLSALPTKDYNGYIVRIIEGSDRNFDFIYNTLNAERPFEIIVGDYRTKISFNIPPDHFLKQWNKITIKFDTDNDRLTVYDGRRTYAEGGLHLKTKGCYKFYFGANSDRKFKTNFVLEAKYRNIRITKNGSTKYYWPLDEQEGLVAHELINAQNGRVKNPLWLASTHQNWKKVGDYLVKGLATTAFDSKAESLFILGGDSLFTFDLHNSAISAKSNRGKIEADLGTQSIYNPINNKIYNFLPYMQAIGRYSVADEKWDKKLPFRKRTSYFYANKVISRRDSSMYVFGGFGAFQFKNEVKRLPLKTERWEDVKPVGDFFMPSYLSALGSNSQGDTIYVLGGYGSITGSEMVNPKNIYSMMRFTTRDKRFKKLYDLKHEGDDFVFASSLVIDSSSKTYYGLVFPHNRNNTNLRLITGSLENNEYRYIAGSFPYRFFGDFSFADLFYCPESRKFVAVTSVVVEGFRTRVKIYALQGPPLNFQKSKVYPKPHTSPLFIGLTLFAALAIGGLFFFLRRRKRHTFADNPIRPIAVKAKPDVTAKNAVFLFGDLQVFDRDGEDITKLFTPLQKELFLLLLVNSIKNGRGLHAEKLDETLWFGKSEQSIRNNRSVNIAKLKSILEKIEHAQLVRNADYWKIEFDYDFWYIDYHDYLKLIEAKKKLDEQQQIRLLFELTRRGNFLSNHNYEWLDQFKAEISNEVIDVFLMYANSNKSGNPEFLIQIANFIFYFDPVSEEAMVIKCKALSSLGKHSLAKKAYDVFVKEYKTIYNEDFSKNFNEIV